MPVSKICENCKKPFAVKACWAEQRKYCSRACMKEFESVHGRPVSQAVPLQFTCQQCGGPFQMKPAYVTAYRKLYGRDPKYCSRRCMGDAKRLTDAEWQVDCIQCGKPMPIQRRPGGTVNRQKRLCSTECRSAFRRVAYQRNRPDQEITKRVVRNGYVRLIVPGKDGEPSRDILEHRYNMEQHLGRALQPGETIHHRDGDRQNNKIENLELHVSNHGPGQEIHDVIAWCIAMLRRYPDFAARAGVALVDVTAVGHQPITPPDQSEPREGSG